MKVTSLQQLIDLTDKTAIVTGGAMGIGLAIATRLAEAGATVAIVDFNEAAGNEAVRKLIENKGNALFIKADVSDEAQVKVAIDTVVKTEKKIDILVNNAGIYPMIPVMQQTAADFDKIIAVNLKSVFLFTKYVAQAMIAEGNGGKIINITSIDAIHPSSVGLATYDASKHGIWGFTKNTALEFAPHGIAINAIAPGTIETPGTSQTPATPEIDAMRKKFTEKIPMRRMGEPDDIGKVALFLASDLSSYMKGEQIVVDGGFLVS